MSELIVIIYFRLGIIELLHAHPEKEKQSMWIRPNNSASFTVCNLSRRRNVWAGHCFQNHLLNPDTDERGRQLSGYPRHNQKPLHEDANELLDTQLGRSWSDSWSFPRSVFDARAHHHLPTRPDWRGTLPPFHEWILGVGSIVPICVFAGFHRFRTLLRHHETVRHPPQNHN